MRRRYVQIEGELQEVGSGFDNPARGGGASGDAALWNDRVYQDGGDPRFTSRKQHRDYMHQHGLTTVDDYSNQWRQDEARRIDFRATGRDPTRLQHMIEAIHKLENR